MSWSVYWSIVTAGDARVTKVSYFSMEVAKLVTQPFCEGVSTRRQPKQLVSTLPVRPAVSQSR